MMEETDQWSIQMKEEEKNLWDMSVANDIANGEVGLTLKKNQVLYRLCMDFKISSDPD